MREQFELFAGVRPIRTYPGMPIPLADPRAQHLDIVLIREQTEGIFAGRADGVIEDDQRARDTMMISRPGSERLFDFAFDLARRRKADGLEGRVTCVDKANILRSFYFFRQIFDERAEKHRDVGADHCYVDAMAMNLVKQPWHYDVIVTENMFGDIPLRCRRGTDGRHGHGTRRPTSGKNTPCSNPATAPLRILPARVKPIRPRCFCQPR